MELSAMLERWVGAGLITTDQAAAIRRAEQAEQAGADPQGDGAPPGEAAGKARDRSAQPPARQPPRTTALVAEAVGYVGATLAFVAALIIAEQFWADLQAWARTGLAALAWLALLGAGAVVAGGDAGPAARLRQVLWTLSVASCALTLWLAAYEVAGLDDDAATLVAAAGTAAYSGWLWWRRPFPLLHAATFVAVVTTVLAGLSLIDPSLGDWSGLALWGVGVAWALLAWGGLLRPAGVGYVLGGIAALFGPLLLVDGPAGQRGALLLGLVTAAALVAASVVLRRTAVLAVGAIGIFGYVPALVFEYFADALGAPVALFVTGVLLVAAALVLGRLSGATRREQAAG